MLLDQKNLTVCDEKEDKKLMVFSVSSLPLEPR